MKTTRQIETLGPSFVRVDGVPMAPPDVRKNFVQTLKDASAPVIDLSHVSHVPKNVEWSLSSSRC